MQAARLASGFAEGSTAYLNLETGDCHGDDVSVQALIQSGVSRVVIGLKNPLRHCRGLAIKVNNCQINSILTQGCETPIKHAKEKLGQTHYCTDTRNLQNRNSIPTRLSIYSIGIDYLEGCLLTHPLRRVA